MDCRNCQPTLIDLLYGELATDAAEAARAHLRDCANCRGAYDKLAAGLRVARTLELVEPPPRVEQKLLELAQARALAIAEQRAAALPPPLSPWRQVIDFVRRLAMARQANMVAVSLLVAAVVMLALPQLLVQKSMEMKPAGQSASRIPVAPDVQEETAPSDGVKPAERLGLKVDSHSGRIRSADDESAAGFAPAAEAPTAADAREEKKASLPRAPAAHAYRARGDLEYAKSETLAKDKQRQQAASIDDLLDGAQAPRAASRAEAAPNAFPSNQAEVARAAAPKKKAALDEELSDKLAAPSASGGRASGAGTSVRPNPGPQAQSMPAMAPPPRVTSTQASAPARSAPAPLAAQLQAARAIAQRDGCAVALSRYQQIVAAGGGSLEAGEALLDMARCRTTLGQPTLARALLERAAQIPAVAPRARALLSAESDALVPMGGPPAAGPGR